MRLTSILLTLALLYLLVCLAMALFQRQLMYFPAMSTPPPASIGLRGVAVVQLATPDGETLELWYSAPSPDAPTILYLHGNAGSIAGRAQRMADFQAAGFGAAFLSYRGYGNSTGSPGEVGLLTDAQTAYDWLRDQGIAAAKIVPLGESLGTGPATQLAATNEVGALILGAPYTATVDIAASQFPWLPVRLLMQDQFKSRDHIAAVTAPIHITHGTADSVIPYAHGRALAALATTPVTFNSIEGAGHDITLARETTATEITFLRAVLGAP